MLAPASQVDFKGLLALLVKEPSSFTPGHLTQCFALIFTPTPGSSEIPPTQLAAFLTALHITHLDHRPEFLAAAASFLKGLWIKADVEGYEEDFVVDIVGTGGDGHDTFNVSTTAAIVAAGAGARVCKHGSRASTSSSGSADLLQSLGVIFNPVSPQSSSKGSIPLPRIPFTFLLAPSHHPSLAQIAPIRKSLPFRTIFNLLGPLINPASPRGLILGVAIPSLGRTFAEALQDGGVKRAIVVCGHEGLDEISCAGSTSAWKFGFEGQEEGQIDEIVLHPDLFGLPVHPLSLVKGSTPAQNAETFKTLLRPSSPPVDIDASPNLKAILDFVLLNASALLVVSGVAKDWKHGVELARQSVQSGKAWEALQCFVDESVKQQ